MYRQALAAPVSYQWDPDSRYPLPDPGSAPDNCGPTAIEMVGEFYNDRGFGIYRTRKLAAASYGPTSFYEQMTMLNKLGVRAVQWRGSVAALRDIVAGGRWPVVIGMLFAYVPDDIAGHPFNGWHAVVVADTAERNGVRGFWVRDPNFNRTFRRDPTDGRRFYPEWVIQSAFVNAGGWGIKPEKPKAILRYARLNGNGIRLRYGPGKQGTNDLARLFATTQDGKLVRHDGAVIWEDRIARPIELRGFVLGARHGIGAYPRSWAKVVIRGQVRYVARPLITRI